MGPHRKWGRPACGEGRMLRAASLRWAWVFRDGWSGKGHEQHGCGTVCVWPFANVVRVCPVHHVRLGACVVHVGVDVHLHRRASPKWNRSSKAFLTLVATGKRDQICHTVCSFSQSRTWRGHDACQLVSAPCFHPHGPSRLPPWTTRGPRPRSPYRRRRPQATITRPSSRPPPHRPRSRGGRKSRPRRRCTRAGGRRRRRRRRLPRLRTGWH